MEIEKKVYIVGAGAIGKTLAVFLRSQGTNAVLVRASTNDITEEILPLTVTLPDRVIITMHVPVVTFSSQQQLDGVIVLTNKSHANNSIAEKLKGKVGESPIVLMQNGLNIEQPFLTSGFKNIYRCVLFVSSQNTDNNTVSFKPVAFSQIGIIKGNSAQLPDIIALLDNPHFRFQASQNIQPVIWQKVIANCVFNSICTLLEVDNGIFHRDETARALAVTVIDECVNVASEVGVLLHGDEVLQTVLKISKSSDGQLISTLQDILNKRATEIDSLNFAIVQAAIQANKPHSTPITKILGELTRLKSDLSMKR